jgi:hypothetical protein
MNDPRRTSTANSTLKDIEAHFSALPNRVFWPSDLIEVFYTHRAHWKLPKSMTAPKFLDFLLRRTSMKEILITSTEYPHLYRYTWGNDVPVLALAQSIKRNAYFSHASAAWILGFASYCPELYINAEQGPKAHNGSILTQDAINRAFKGRQRKSKLIYEYANTRITVLSGKNTGRLGVVAAVAPTGEVVQVTSLERTLVDIAVRPAYAGGVEEVLKVYEAVRHRVSLELLFETLHVLEYSYPYHQSIGFYLRRAAYDPHEIKRFAAAGMKYDFYISYDMIEPAFDAEWRVYYPSSLDKQTTH